MEYPYCLECHKIIRKRLVRLSVCDLKQTGNVFKRVFRWKPKTLFDYHTHCILKLIENGRRYENEKGRRRRSS